MKDQSPMKMPPIPTHWQNRWEYYRRVAIGMMFTLKGEARAIGVHDLLEVRCPFDHHMQMKARSLLRGTRCATCAETAQNAFRDRQLEDAKEIASARGGACLSLSYENARERLKWECHRGHQWSASLDNVRSKGSWCPRCAKSKPRPGRRAR